MNFLFWNIGKKNIYKTISALCSDYNIDILILAESQISDFDMLQSLNKDKVAYSSNSPISQCEKIKIYTRFKSEYIAPIKENKRYTLRLLTIPDKIKINLIGIHFIDKMNNDEEDQRTEAEMLTKWINDIETQTNNCNTIVVGDFNMNPFETPMISAKMFNASKSSKIAIRGTRIVRGITYKYFYNPMWGLLGDLNSDIAGTYFYQHSLIANYNWNIFDQVILRPDLIDKFDKPSLKIIQSLKDGTSLIKNNRPDKDKFSDHLPIMFTLNI